jgi:hypothetical protein
MEVIDIRPQHGGGNTVALFDVQLGEHIKMFNLKLVRGRDGMRVYAPSAFGSNVAAFTVKLADQMIRAAMAALGEVTDERAA